MLSLPRLLCLLLLSLCVTGHASLPEVGELERQLDELNSRDTLTQSQTRDRQALEAALRFANDQQRSQQALAALNQRLGQVSQDRSRINRTLANLTADDPEALEREYDEADIRTLITTLNATLAELEAHQNDLAEVSSELINYQTLPERAQTLLARDLARSEEIRQLLARSQLREGGLSVAERDSLRIELASLTNRMELNRRELWSVDSLHALASQRQQLLNQQISTAELKVALLQDEINRKRRARTEQMIAEALADLPDAFTDKPLVRDALASNRKLADQLLALTESTNTLIRDNVRIDTSLDRSRQTLRNLNDQIDLLQGSLLLSRVIYAQQAALPKVVLVEGLEQRLADLRMQQFRLREQREQLRDPARYAEQLLKAQQASVAEEVLSTLTRIMEIRRDLVGQLDDEIGRQLNLAINVQLNQQQLEAIHRALRNTIREQSFWMPSNQAVNLAWLLSMPVALAQQTAALPLAAVSSELLQALADDIWLITPFMLVSALVFTRRRTIKNTLAELQPSIGRVREDSQKHTPLALLYSALLDAPVPILLLGAAAVFHGAEGTYQHVTALTLMRVAAAWLVFSLCHRLLAPEGIGERHFGWPKENLVLLRRRILAIGVVILALLPVATIGEQWPELLAEDRLGLVTLAAANLALAVLFYRLALAWPFSERGDLLRRLAAYGLASVPLFLMTLALVGYYYTSVKVAGRLLDSFYLLLLWVLLQATAVRGLSVAARRLAFSRALAKRAARLEAKDKDEGGSADGGEAIEEPQLDVEKINQQSLRLLRIGLFAVFGTVLYLVWADLLGTIGYMDNVVLWESVSGTGDNLQVARTSLGNLFSALVIIVIAALLIRNLPGLLEVLILSRMALAPGSSYTITTLVKYVIFSVALVSSLSAMGFAWNKLQWLVAALGVGLGFGLQEIFANFVSGLIILFERPIRIGDTITVGNLSGTVSKIRIRATTIIDFDRKEIIVPNKTFVTDQLVNWTLTDPVTRITLKVGFAYGSDLDKAKAILLQAANENARVMHEPEPLVFFLAFGASTLDHELRVHVRELGDRLRATDELNRRIDALCKEQEVEIAFNQLDVHLYNANGDSACVSREEINRPPA
ncbi:MAG: mechanosensitive channel MscK [Alcanivoracaceae bacterium]